MTDMTESNFDDRPHDRWLAAECLSIIGDQAAFAAKHLEKFIQNRGEQESFDTFYFAGFTMHTCTWASMEIAYPLVHSQTAHIGMRRSALLTIVLNAPYNLALQWEIEPEIIREILTADDPDSKPCMDLIRVVEALLLHKRYGMFDLSEVNLSEILNRLCKESGLESRVLPNDEAMLVCIDDLKVEMRKRNRMGRMLDSDEGD